MNRACLAPAVIRGSRLLVALLGFWASAVAAEPASESRLGDLAEREPDLSVFLRAVEDLGLAATLTGSPYTAFAPTDDAFTRAGTSIDMLLRPEHAGRLLKMLRAHLVADDIDIEMALGLGQARTLDGGSMDIYMEGDRLMVGDAYVLRSGIRQGGLRIYSIDRLLTPPERLP